MAFYSQKITIPADTQENDPVIVDITLKEKWVEEIWVGFEDGCAWLVKVRINYGIRRYFPENQGEWIYGNDVFVPIRQIIKLPEKQEYIRVIACSPGTKYDHNIFVCVWTSEDEPIPIGVGIQKLIQIFKGIFY